MAMSQTSRSEAENQRVVIRKESERKKANRCEEKKERKGNKVWRMVEEDHRKIENKK